MSVQLQSWSINKPHLSRAGTETKMVADLYIVASSAGQSITFIAHCYCHHMRLLSCSLPSPSSNNTETTFEQWETLDNRASALLRLHVATSLMLASKVFYIHPCTNCCTTTSLLGGTHFHTLDGAWGQRVMWSRKWVVLYAGAQKWQQ